MPSRSVLTELVSQNVHKIVGASTNLADITSFIGRLLTWQDPVTSGAVFVLTGFLCWFSPLCTLCVPTVFLYVVIRHEYTTSEHKYKHPWERTQQLVSLTCVFVSVVVSALLVCCSSSPAAMLLTMVAACFVFPCPLICEIVGGLVQFFKERRKQFSMAGAFRVVAQIIAFKVGGNNAHVSAKSRVQTRKQPPQPRPFDHEFPCSPPLSPRASLSAPKLVDSADDLGGGSGNELLGLLQEAIDNPQGGLRCDSEQEEQPSNTVSNRHTLTPTSFVPIQTCSSVSPSVFSTKESSIALIDIHLPMKKTEKKKKKKLFNFKKSSRTSPTDPSPSPTPSCTTTAADETTTTEADVSHKQNVEEPDPEKVPL